MAKKVQGGMPKVNVEALVANKREYREAMDVAKSVEEAEVVARRHMLKHSLLCMSVMEETKSRDLGWTAYRSLVLDELVWLEKLLEKLRHPLGPRRPGVVQRIKRLASNADNPTDQQIAMLLKREGYRIRDGKPFSVAYVKKLRQRFYGIKRRSNRQTK